jgi:hypothetical protein
MKNKIIKQIGTFPLLQEQYRKNFPTGIIVLKHGEHKGAGIYCEFDDLRGFQRPMIVRSRIGTVVLERQRINGLTFYSVVTAFGGTKARGIKIGIMPK